MKRITWITAAIYLLGIVLTAFFLFMAEKGPGSVESRTKARLFEGFPLGIERPVKLNLNKSATFYGLSPEKMTEQIRDWLLYLVLTSARLDAGEMAFATYDMPPIRRGYTKSSANYQYGPIRSAFFGDGTAIVLLPKGQTRERRSDSLSHVADRYFLVQNNPLRRLHVFEYCISLPESLTADNLVDDWLGIEHKYDAEAMARKYRLVSASLKNQGVLRSERLSSSEFGWVERVLRSKEDLAQFLSDTDDLISIHPGLDGLVAIGRKYKSRSYGQLTVEHIATLWQAYMAIDRERTRESGRAKALVNNWTNRMLKNYLSGINVAFANRFVRVDEQGNYDLDWGYLGPKVKKKIASLRENFFSENKEIYERLQDNYGGCKWQAILHSLKTKKTGATSLGDFESMVSEFKAFKNGISSHRKSLLRGSAGFSLDSDYNFEVLTNTFLDFIKTDKSFITDLLVDYKGEILDNFKKEDPNLLLCLLQELDDQEDDTFYRYVQSSIISPARYQVARYDGGIEGTEVGQILFVTDLLAKLLDFDFSGIFQKYFKEVHVEWIPSTYKVVPVMYKEQQKKLPGTRLWFGIKNEAYAVAETADIVRFAPIATRVYALSRKLFGKDEETQPAYLATQFVDWFNNYFERVGEVEPNYDRLNQIIKWSIAIDYIRKKTFIDSGGLLSSLTTYPVRRDLWFPDWAKTNTAYPDALPWVDCFHPRGTYRDNIETMPVFHVGWKNAPRDWCGGVTPEGQYRIWAMNGGVSLPRASKALGNYRPSMLKDVPLGRRANIAKEGLKVGDPSTIIPYKPEYNYSKIFKITKGIKPNSSRILRRTQGMTLDKKGAYKPVEKAVYHRGTIAEVKDFPHYESFSVDSDLNQVTVRSSIGGWQTAKTSFTATPSKLQIEQQSDLMDIGHSLGLRLGRIKPEAWPTALRKNHRVEAVAKLDDASVIVKLKQHESWIELKAEPKPSVDIPETWQARVSDKISQIDLYTKRKPNPVLVKVVPEAELARRVAKLERLTIKQHIKSNLERSIEIRGPPGPPLPPKGPSVLVGSPDGPFRGSYDAKRLLFVFEKQKRAAASPEELSRFIKSLNDVDLNKTMAAASDGRKGSVVIPLKKSLPKITPEEIARLREQRSKAFAVDLRHSSKETIAYIRKVRSDYHDTLARAMDAADEETVSRLVPDFQRSFSFTPEERINIAVFESEALLSKKQYNLVKEIVKEAKRPADIPKEFADHLKTALQAEGQPAAEETAKAMQLVMAKAGQKRGPPELDVPIELATSGDRTISRAGFYFPFKTRRLAPKDLKKNVAYYVDRRIKLTELPTPQTIESIVDDPIVVEIHSPENLVGKSISDLKPDIISLGNAIEFRRGSKQAADFDFGILRKRPTEEWVPSVTESFMRLSRLNGSSPGAYSVSSGADDDEGEEEKSLLLTSRSLLCSTTCAEEICDKKIEDRNHDKQNGDK